MTKVAVIGAGVMGRGIAYAFATAGYNVYLNDLNLHILQQSEQKINNLLTASYERGFLTQEVLQQAKENIVYETNIKKAATDANLVVEAVLEKMELKVEVFKQLDNICPRETIFATNTSTMSPTEIGAQTTRPDKFIAMHFFNPVHKMKLIEVIKGLDTSDDTFLFIKDIAENLNKEVVEVNEFPGFITSRMNCLIGNEAMTMLQEGVASAEHIDKAMKLGLNHPMGPLELADLVGLDTRLRNMEYLYATLGEKYRPAPILIKYVKAGRLGRKSGSGFYKYD